ncbi:MAG: DEAD/DEAH box helicase [Bacillales bacterium]|nr:DEAD/DEAH box helicase [Bacillales bacterium]
MNRFSPSVQFFLSGRHLLLSELSFPQDLIQHHLNNGYLQLEDGIRKEGRIYVCARCGNRDPKMFASFPCAHCQKFCVYCRHCVVMGRVSECTPLVSWKGPPPDSITSQEWLQWDGRLSEGQETAACAVQNAVEKKEDLLVWAVCGAGKTEILFYGINAALQKGERVCIAAPRTDVVLELATRLQKVFPLIPITALYGGSPQRNEYGSFVISTTHQLYRYKEAFDVVIVDEVDAFPYSYDPTLQYAVEKSRNPSSAMIYLTATPNETWQQQCRQGKRKFVSIPARYHRHPLPVPKVRWIGNWKKSFEKGRIPKELKDWTQNRLARNKQALLFFPSVRMINSALPLFQTLHSRIEAVHAEDPARIEKVEGMRRKEIPVMLTTTILERGVTFPNLDVAVVGAEESIFDESALVQISGRVGRSADYPDGEIMFFHYGLTREIIKAIRHIERMNRDAKKKGLID